MAGAVRRFGSMGGFTKHRTGGGGGDYLKKWKDRGYIEVWFHIKELPLAMWRHQIPMIVIVDDKQTRTKVAHAWSKNFVCFEDESVLEQQYFRAERGDPSSPRKHPPKRCGVCKLVEWCYQQCIAYEVSREENAALAKAGKKAIPFEGIKFTTPMFKFEGDDPKETQIIHIGGICNLFNKDHSDAQKADMAEAKIRKSEAWKENMYAKCQYAMCVVNNDAPEDGVQIAVEASSLGDKVKEVLDDMVESDKREYERNPYAIKWKYNEAETDLNKKYKALPMRETALTPRIKKLITGEAPTQAIEKLTERFNQQTVRASLEEHCLLPKGVVPWDELFPTVAQSKKWDEEDAQAEAEAAAAADAEEGDREPGDDTDDVSGDASSDDEVFACNNDECDQVVKATDKVCPKCGEVYEVETKDDADDNDAQEPEPEPEPVKPPLRKRAAAAPAAPAASAKPAAAKPAAGGGGSAKGKGGGKPSASSDPADQDSEVPF